MSVVGIDLGNINTVIAVARNRGVDIICNEVSNRTTPLWLHSALRIVSWENLLKLKN